jgi:hypothetical protein
MPVKPFDSQSQEENMRFKRQLGNTWKFQVEKESLII